MDFALTQEQRLIQESAHAFLRDTATLERLKTVLESDIGWDVELWSGLTRDLGFSGLLVPEDHGGSGLSAVEMALVLEETGRSLAAVPFLETAVLAVHALLAAGDATQCARWLPALASGELKATFVGASERPSFSAHRLIGQVRFVTFGHIADLLIVATDDDSLIALPASTAGVRVTRTSSLDRTRPIATLTFDVEVPPDAVLGERGGATAAIARALSIGAGLLAAEQTGGAQFCLDSTVAYAKERVQFGRPIGSFQAVKHELADMMVLIEASRSASYYAAAAIHDDGAELAEACAIAASWASECYRHCSGEAIQLHGGIGFTWEHHAHLYFKRARASSTWLGSPEAHREALAQIILQEPA